ncbi:MAG: hypothetical protein IJI22_01535 [Bacilli bacterium]|nr:hypothetical protein [Bacilli bacterium]
MYNRKKELRKNIIYSVVILLLAVFSTYYIYNKFQGDREIDFSSESLDVIYHEGTGDKITISKMTPVTDSVGLSSKSYNVSLKNNLTEDVLYTIKIVDDLEQIEADSCGDMLIPKDNIRISVKINKHENAIYQLDELDDGILLHDTIDALDTADIAIRVWIKQDSNVPAGSKLHYHGKIQVVEEDGMIAINK